MTSAGNLGAMRSSLNYIRRLARFLERERIEVLHTNSLKASILGGMAGRLSGVQVVWHVRDRIAADYLLAKVVMLMRGLAKVLPHFVMGNSLATLETLDLPRTPTAAIASGVDLGKFFAPKEEQRGLAIRVAEARPVIGLVGRICPWKGQHVFIEAAATVHARYPEARFQIIGAALFKEHAYELELHRRAETARLIGVLEFTINRRSSSPAPRHGMTTKADLASRRRWRLNACHGEKGGVDEDGEVEEEAFLLEGAEVVLQAFVDGEPAVGAELPEAGHALRDEEPLVLDGGVVLNDEGHLGGGRRGTCRL